MPQVNFKPLMKKVADDEKFGSKLIAFAKDHGVDMLSGEELSEEELDEVSGGTSFTGSTLSVNYEPTEFPKGFFSEQEIPGSIW